MLHIIHGEDTVSSRNKLQEFLEKKVKIARIDGDKTPVEGFLNELSARDLFETQRIVVLENPKKYFPSDKFWKEINKFSDSKDTEILVWNDGAIDVRQTKKFLNPKIQIFELPKYYFAFLDGIFPGEGGRVHEVLSKLSEQMTDEQIFYAMVKRVRALILLKNGDKNEFSDTKNMQDWQAGKLQKQANSWTNEKLSDFYAKLFDLEKGMKTSSLSQPLIRHIDILLLSEI